MFRKMFLQIFPLAKQLLLWLGVFFILPTAVVGCAISGENATNNVPLILETDVEPTNPPATQERKRVALVMKTLTNPFFVEMEQGARSAANNLGVELIVRTAAQETSIAQQISIVDDLIQDQVDAIVIAPGDSAELVPVLKKAQDAGIAVVNIDNRLDTAVMAQHGLENVPFISVDNEEAAYLSAKVIADQVSEPTKAAILEGIRTADNAQARLAGAQRAFAENPNITVVASETANWKIDEAHDVAQEIFTEHPDVELVFAANDMMALGVINYLQEVGRDDVLVAGFDALAEAQPALENGSLIATIDQQASQQGFLGVVIAKQILDGDYTYNSETMINVVVVTSPLINDE